MKKISTDIILEMKICIYKHISDKIGHLTTVRDFFEKFSPACYELIKELRTISSHELQREYKKDNLPAALFSCISGTDKSIIASRNDLMILDIDLNDNLNLANNLDYYKNEIFKLPYVYLVSKSCSGNGIFVVVVIDNKDDYTFLNKFKALEQEFKELFDLVLDKNCKNINRLRYISYDDKLLIKTNTEIEYFDKVYIQEEYTKQNQKTNFKSSNTLIYDEKFVYDCVNSLIDNGYQSSDYMSWLLDGFRLAAFQNFGEELFLKLSRNSSNYKNDEDVITKFKNCSRTTKWQYEDAAIYYFGQAKILFGDNWIYKIKNNII